VKAIRIHAHGDFSALKMEELPRPDPKSGEVLVRIHSVALNHLDLWVRKGLPGISLPIIPGSDGSGTIEKLGENLPDNFSLKMGDPVIILPFRTCRQCTYCRSGNEELCNEYQIPGEQIDGTMAEFVSIPSDYLLQKPENLNLNHAAAFPLVFLTAFHMLTCKANLQKDNRVFIWGASSGIGHAAIQIARNLGAQIITTAGTTAKEEFAKKMGADFVINYTNSDVAEEVKKLTGGHGVDIVFEHVGQESWSDSLKILARGGKIVTCGATTGATVRINLRHLFIKHQQIIGSTMGNRNDMIEIIKLIEGGILKPHIDNIFSIDKIGDAHEYLESGKQMGKVVVSFEGDDF
jgi:NADPH:quinone reductase-like Zn-dependent oxidoreductase